MVFPIIRSFLKHKLTVILLVLEVAITTGLSCNLIHLAAIKVHALSVPTGVSESRLALIDSLMLDANANYVVSHANDLAALTSIPGVTQAAAVDSVPLGKNNWTLPIRSAPPSDTAGVLKKPSIYTGTPGALRTLGLKLVAGRDFLPGEYQPVGSAHGYVGVTRVNSAILTRQLAEKYFPDGAALGHDLYLPNGQAIHVVGIVDHLLRPQLTDANDAEDTLLLPLLPDQSEVVYVVRTDVSDKQRILAAAKAALIRVNTRRLIQFARPFEEIRDSYFAADQTMLELLCAAGAGLIFVAVVSIGGLANFWVMQRRQQIGIRRALGATRGDIRWYFQLENLILVGAGAVLGVLLAPLLGNVIMKYFEAQSLPLGYLPLAVLMFCMIGQFSVLVPAIHAARLAPIAAIRRS